MSWSSKSPNILNNEEGILTLDFIFASMLAFAFSMILFAFSMTFTAVEVAQYATYSSARAHFAAHKNSDIQVQKANEKFESLVTANNAKLGFLFKNGWFELNQFKIDNFNDDFGESGNGATFIGARAVLSANILDFNIPMLGSSDAEDLGANVSSYLLREPTEEECIDFVNQRLQKLKQLPGGGYDVSFVDESAYVPMFDGGC